MEEEHNILSEYTIVKYILTIIPVFLSFIFFIFTDDSIMSLLKIVAGYSVVLSLFFLSDENIYFHFKKNINNYFKNASILTIIFFAGMIFIYFLDVLFINMPTNADFIELEIILILYEVFIRLSHKIMFSSLLFLLTFYINVIILTIIIKFDIANRVISRFYEEDN